MQSRDRTRSRLWPNPVIGRVAVQIRFGLIAAQMVPMPNSASGHLRKSETVPGASAPGGQAEVTRRKADILVDLDRQHREEREDEAERNHELLNLMGPNRPRTPRNTRKGDGNRPAQPPVQARRRSGSRIYPRGRDRDLGVAEGLAGVFVGVGSVDRDRRRRNLVEGPSRSGCSSGSPGRGCSRIE